MRLQTANPNPVQPGEKVQCSFCRDWFTVEDAAERAVGEVLKEYEKASEAFVHKVQVIFSSNVEAIMGKLEKIDVTTTTTMSTVLETQKMVQSILDRLNVPVQAGGGLIGDASARAEATEAASQLGKALVGLGEDALRSLDSDTLLRVGNIYYEMLDFKEALSYYQRAVVINSNNAIAWFNVGLAYGKLGDHQKEIEMYGRAVKIKPDYATVWYNMGLAYYELKKYQTAVEMQEKAVKVKPDYAEAWAKMGQAYSNQGGSWTDRKGIMMYEEVVKLKPDDAKSWMAMGQIYLRLGDLQKAKEMFDRAAEVTKPDDFDMWLYLGSFYSGFLPLPPAEGLNEQRKAIEMYEKAIKLRPADSSCLYRMGKAYEELGEYRKAIEMREEYIRIKGKDGHALLNLAELYEKVGDKAKAKSLYADAAIQYAMIESNSSMADYCWKKEGKINVTRRGIFS